MRMTDIISNNRLFSANFANSRHFKLLSVLKAVIIHKKSIFCKLQTFSFFIRIVLLMIKDFLLKTAILLSLLTFSLLSFGSSSLTAVKIDNSPKIDGVLSEDFWKNIKGFSDFTQSYPNPGSSPTFKTEVKIAYDEKNIYIGVYCFDGDPSQIDRSIQRRDRNELTDSVTVQLDPFKTNREAYGFIMSASSSIADFFVYNEFSSNWEWNGIWEGKASINSDGWSAEFEIPFSTLRVFHSDGLPMGIQVSRKIKRLKEFDVLSYIAPFERKNVSGFAQIEGLEGVKSGKKADIIPFLVLKDRFHTREGFYKRGGAFDAGVDFTYPLSSRFTLTGTINPDFGQVEQDSAVLNLSTYETYFPENRPFFLEGFQMLTPPRTSLGSGTTFLYTRRIGSPPYEPSSYEGHDVTYAPENTTILGALKISGTTTDRLNIAGFLAVTQSERATYADENGNLQDEILKRETLFEAFRINQNFGTNSSIGLLQTYKDEVGGRKALLTALTCDLHSSENKHNLSFSVSNTDIDDKDIKSSGTAFETMAIEKLSKEWTFSLSYIAHPKDYNPNDMGYLRRNDEYKVVTTLDRDITEPTKYFNQASIGFDTWYGKNGDGLILTRGGQVDFWGEFLNHNSIWGGLSVEFPYFDDREPRIEGFAIYRDTTPTMWMGFSTDSRKNFYISQSVAASKDIKGFQINTDTSYTMRFSDKCKLTQSFEATKNNGAFLFAGVSKSGKYPLFADAAYGEFNLTTRLSYTFTPKLTFDLYSQLFTAAGSYSDFQKLLSATNFAPAEATMNPNFHFATNNITAVLRWEYKTFSSLYVVFSHGQNGFIDFENDDRRAGMSFRREFTLLTSAPRDDLFLIKFSYRF